MSRRCLRRLAIVALAAAPFCFNLAIEARQAAAAQGDAAGAGGRLLRGQGAPGAGVELLRLPRRPANGRAARRLARGAAQGRTSGPAIVPGDADKSLLIQAVRQTNESLKMPKGGRLQRRRDRHAGRVGGRRQRRRAHGRRRRSTAPATPVRQQSPLRPRRRRTRSRRSSARSGRSSRCARRRFHRSRTRRGRRPTSIGSCSRVSSGKGLRRCVRPTSER